VKTGHNFPTEEGDVFLRPFKPWRPDANIVVPDDAVIRVRVRRIK